MRELDLMGGKLAVHCPTVELIEEVVTIAAEKGWNFMRDQNVAEIIKQAVSRFNTGSRYISFNFINWNNNIDRATKVLGSNTEVDIYNNAGGNVVEAEEFLTANRERNGFRVGDIVENKIEASFQLRITNLVGLSSNSFEGMVTEAHANTGLHKDEIYRVCYYKDYKLVSNTTDNLNEVNSPISYKQGDLVSLNDSLYKSIAVVKNNVTGHKDKVEIRLILLKGATGKQTFEEITVRSDDITIINDLELGFKLKKNE